MKSDVVALAVKSLRDRSFRSWITISGIIVSIAVIFILLTLSTGLQLAVVELFEDFGTNRIFIIPGQSSSGFGSLDSENFLDKDVEDIRDVADFELVIPQLYRAAQRVEYRGEERFVNLYGIPSEDADEVAVQYQFDENLVAGRYFTEGEKGVAVVGYNVAYDEDTFFKRDLKIRNTIVINGNRYEVVGIYERLGTPDDNIIYIPFEDMRELLNVTGEVDFVDAIVKENVDINQAKDKVIRKLERTKGEDAFVVMTPEAIITQFNQTIGIVQAILIAIASVSLLVGAIGIANTMFTSVLEREKEIGIMKAVGAMNKDILTLFMLESGLIGVVGGVVGVVLGIGISFMIGFIAAASGFGFLTIQINLGYVLFCLGFAFVVGVLSGLLPSYLGSKKKIVDTLRDA